jgi:hypothetical protein
MAATLRTVKMSPGLVWVRMPGSTRASAQPMIRILGDWPSVASFSNRS